VIEIHSDVEVILARLDALSDLPDAKAKLLLDGVLEVAFEWTQADVHIDTHSLRPSGRKDSKTIKYKKQWVGEISYGGATAGPKRVVDYAIYEKARGGAHDFFKSLPAAMPLFAEAVREAMR
jgi:hypothetical protein